MVIKSPLPPPGADPVKADAKIDQYLAYAREKLPLRAKHGDVKVIDDFIQAVREEVFPWTHETANDVDSARVTKSRQMRVYETQRRADRAFVVALRVLQAKGLIATQGNNKPHDMTIRSFRTASPSAAQWALAGVSDAAFEAAIVECRAADVMTRTAINRVLAGEPARHVKPHNSRKVKITDAATQRRAYEGAITVMSGLTDGLKNLGETHSSISEGERATWLHELRQHRSVLSTAMNHLAPTEWRARKQAQGQKAAAERLRRSRAKRMSSPS